MSWFTIKPVDSGVWNISEAIGKVEPRFGVGTVNVYLVAGNERAALIDTGMGIGDLRAAVTALTPLPVTVCNTHWHWDHSGSNSQFDRIAIHHSEAKYLERDQDMAGVRKQMEQPAVRAILPDGFDTAAYRVFGKKATQTIRDGDTIDLGGRTLQVIETPGHSHGHVAYFDADAGLLFSGDTAYRGPMYACFKGGDPAAFQASAHKLAQMADNVKCVLPGHNELLTGGAFLRELAEAGDQAMSGAVAAKPADEFIGGREVSFGSFSIWLPKEA